MNTTTMAGGAPLTSLQDRIAVSPTRVVAHRGFHDNLAGPYENSLQSFKNGIAAGFEMVETDVQRTKDNVLVLHHDPDFGKGSTKIEELTYAELPLLADGQRIPTLDELLDLARAPGVTTKLDIEIKQGGYEQQILEAIQAKVPNDRFELISFSAKSIEAIERLDPTVRTGVLAPRLYEWMRESALYPAAVWLSDKLGWHRTLDRAAKIGADYVSVDRHMATDSFIRDAAKRGIAMDVWTVDDEPTMHRLLNAGVQGIVTNAPDVATTLRDSGPPTS